MKLSYISYTISLNSICHYIKLIIKNKSPIRIFHNYFLKRIKLKGNTIDLGCGNHSSYFNFMENKSNSIKESSFRYCVEEKETMQILGYGYNGLKEDYIYWTKSEFLNDYKVMKNFKY